MDEITKTIIPDGGFGGGNALALGAGAIGGLLLGTIWVVTGYMVTVAVPLPETWDTTPVC